MEEPEDENKSEDEILAKEVPDIDLIISGHTHSELKEAIQHGNTYIVSCGEYGRNLGSLSMTQKQDGRWELTSYELIPVSEDVKPDQATQEQIDALMDTVDKNYLPISAIQGKRFLLKMMLNSTVWKKWVRCTKS